MDALKYGEEAISVATEEVKPPERLRASAHDAPGFARFHDDGTA